MATAADTLDKVSQYCLRSTGIENIFEAELGNRYMVSSTVNLDGTISGVLYRLKLADEWGIKVSRKKVGAFLILSDGTLKRAPEIMRLVFKHCM